MEIRETTADVDVTTWNVITGMKGNAAGKEIIIGKENVIGNAKGSWNAGSETMDVDARKHVQFRRHRQDHPVHLLTTVAVIKDT